MKLVEFVKRNISILSFLGFLFLIVFLFSILLIDKKGNDGDIIFVFIYILLPVSILFLIIDFVLKKLIINRLNLNFLQLSILLLLFLYYSFTYNK
jgi:hypothetical protein